MNDLTVFLRKWHWEVQQRGDEVEAARIKAVMDRVNPFISDLGIAVEPKGPRDDVFTRDGDMLRQSTISKKNRRRGEIYHTRIPYTRVQKIIAIIRMEFDSKPFTRLDLEKKLQEAGVPADGKSYCCVLRWMEYEGIIPEMGNGAATTVPGDLAKRISDAWAGLPVLPTSTPEDEAVAG